LLNNVCIGDVFEINVSEVLKIIFSPETQVWIPQSFIGYKNIYINCHRLVRGHLCPRNTKYQSEMVSYLG
jgi:hypothetical protein